VAWVASAASAASVAAASGFPCPASNFVIVRSNNSKIGMHVSVNDSGAMHRNLNSTLFRVLIFPLRLIFVEHFLSRTLFRHYHLKWHHFWLFFWNILFCSKSGFHVSWNDWNLVFPFGKEKCRIYWQFLHGPFCHGALKLDISTLFKTFFLWNLFNLYRSYSSRAKRGWYTRTDFRQDVRKSFLEKLTTFAKG